MSTSTPAPHTRYRCLVIGPGYIGSAVASCISQCPAFEVAVLVRLESSFKAFDDIEILKIDFGNHSEVSTICAGFEAIINAADADDTELAQAILTGIKMRASQGQATSFIQTSSAKCLDDKALGSYASSQIHRDDVRDVFDSIPDDAPHRGPDLAILSSQLSFDPKLTRIAIMLPPEIYGLNQKYQRLTAMLPKMPDFAIRHGYSGYIGQGLSVETQIHINDLAKAYLCLLEYMHFNVDAPADLYRNPFFFCENGKEFSWKEAASEIGRCLYDHGFIQSPEPKSIPEHLWPEISGSRTGAYRGLNSRTRAIRLRSLGWNPAEDDIWQTMRGGEMQEVLRRRNLVN